MSAAAHHAPISYNPTHSSFTARMTTAARSMLRTLELWRSRIRERGSFTVVDERDLRDLGMSRWQFERELAKPFWRG